MKNLNEDLKTGDFKQIYLLYGEESYLKRQFKNRFIKAMIPDDDTMNFNYYEGKSIDVQGVIESADTLPFFSQCRLIILEESGLFKTGENPLVNYLKEVPETTYFIFIENEVDKRSKMYKVVKEHGSITELSYQGEDILRKWISSLAKNEEKQMDMATIDYLIQKVGVGMENIQNELEKLFAYGYDKSTITKEDIDQVCAGQITNHIFEMVNAVAVGNQRKALDLYYDLLALKEPPMRILFLMIRQYRLMYQVKDLMSRGFDRKEIASKAGIHPFATGKYMEQGRRFTWESIHKVIEEGAHLEESIKVGNLQDRMAVELFIVGNSVDSVKLHQK
jgi:DNA polymerase-3 subunit delta